MTIITICVIAIASVAQNIEVATETYAIGDSIIYQVAYKIKNNNKESIWIWFDKENSQSGLSGEDKARKHFMKMLFTEIILIIILSCIWDYSTGFKMWSINYCLPFLCSIYTMAILIMRLFRKKLAKEFIFYASINSMIGLVPGILLIFDKVTVYWPSYISVIISVIILAFLFVFNKKQVKNELERRFHI